MPWVRVIVGLACLCIFSMSALAADGSTGKTEYMIQAKFYIPHSASLRKALDSIVNKSGVEATTGGNFKLLSFAAADLTLDTIHVIAKGSELSWNGKPEPEAGSGLESLMAPTIRTIANDPAVIRIGQEGVQYFERAKDGLFDLKTVDDFTGYVFSCTPAPVAPGEVRVKWSVEVHRVKERAPIEGVSLDIGKPVITTESLATEAVLKHRNWTTFLISGERDALLVFLRVVEIPQNVNAGEFIPDSDGPPQTIPLYSKPAKTAPSPAGK